MSNITNFKHKLQFYLNLIDKRTLSGDLWGALDASRNAQRFSKSRVEKRGLETLVAQCYFEMGQHSLACRHFFRAVKIPHLRASAFFGIGRSLIFLNQFNLALSYFDASLKFDVNNQFSEAILEWTEVIKQKLKNKEYSEQILLKSAKNLINNKAFNEARHILEPLINKQNLQAENLFCLTFYLEKNEQKTKLEINKILNRYPFDVFSLCLLYEIEPESQFDIINKLKNIDTIDSDELIKLGLFFAGIKDYECALKYFEKLAELKEYIPKTHLFCALCAYNLKDYEKALYNISRAKWLDCENLLYSFYYDIFRMQDKKEDLKIFEDLPLNLKQEKLNNVYEALNRTDFCLLLNKSHFLLEDLEYASINLQLCDKISEKLVKCNNETAKNMFDNMLLSVKHSKKHKFLMCKQALLSEKFNQLDFVMNYKYTSFYFDKKRIKKMNVVLKRAVCNAVAYVHCYEVESSILNSIWEISSQINAVNNLNLSEEELTCLLLSKNTEIMQNACLFFNINQIKVIQLKNMLKLIKTERSFL